MSLLNKLDHIEFKGKKLTVGPMDDKTLADFVEWYDKASADFPPTVYLFGFEVDWKTAKKIDKYPFILKVLENLEKHGAVCFSIEAFFESLEEAKPGTECLLWGYNE